MKLSDPKVLIVAIAAFVCGVGAQTNTVNPPRPLPTPITAPTPRTSELLAKRLTDAGSSAATERANREAAFAKLMEGQRYNWIASRTQNRTRAANAIRLAKQSFQAAVELDPSLSEGYTALAELELSQRQGEAEVDEAIALAGLAIKVKSDSFGARRLLARLYSYKSRVGGERFIEDHAKRAVAEWKEVVKTDPRNAEGWAFLAALYGRLGNDDERIEALRRWLSSASPIDTQFYRLVMGPQENLSPENASMKLGPALLKAGRTREAIETLSLLVAEDPENVTAVEMLRDAVDSAEGDAAVVAIDSLQQAVFANPDNIQLVNLLSRVFSQAGRTAEAIKLFETSSARLVESDPDSAAAMQIALGDLLADRGENGRASAAYDKALELRDISSPNGLENDDREFAMQVFEKMIRVHKSADDSRAVAAAVNRARTLFGKDDLFADRQLIAFYRESGRKREALEAVKAVRSRVPDDLGFVRLEATLLTENGKVDDAVALIRRTMSVKSSTAQGTVNSSGSSVSVGVPMQDEFSNYLFISNLYTQAGRGSDAVIAANKAHEIAQGTERKQIAMLTLATAQNLAGQHDAAEATLREILKRSPGNPIALNNLGYFLLERDVRFEEAKQMIEQAVKIDPTNPSYLDSLGWAYYKLGNYTEAERYLREAARFDSSSAAIQEHLGDVYFKQNKRDLARSAWERALRLASDPADLKRLRQKLGSK